MSLILGLIGLERLELIALELEKNCTFDSVYTLASTIIKQWAPSMVKLYMTIKSCFSSIMAVIGVE